MTDGALDGRWSLGEVSLHNRTQDSTVRRNWNYTVTVGPGGISQATATVLEAYVEATYTANLTVSLTTGSSVTVPVQGTFQASVTSPVVRLPLLCT